MEEGEPGGMSARPTRKSKLAAIEGLQSMSGRGRRQDGDNVSESGEQDFDGDGSDGEVRTPHRSRGRPRADHSEGGSAVRRGRGGGGRGGQRSAVKRKADDDGSVRGRAAAPPPQSAADNSLFELVRNGTASHMEIVDNWIESYKQDRDQALLNLIQFFIQSSGCNGRVTLHMYQNMEHAEIIRKMTEEFDEDSGDYPLIMTGIGYKKFRQSFSEFVDTLVRQCQYSIIYDQYMMDNIIALLTGLTDSQVRAFRHTSTLAAMKLMTALVDVALNLSVTLDHTQRQYETERSKSKGRQATERLEVLMEKRKEIEENQEEIRHMLTYIFKGVFVHRYRDSLPDIRCICTAEIGVWMKRYPSMFLDDSYLKYIGWTLYDRIGEVRLCCLKCLQPLYQTDELKPKLELFTNRFKDRIVEMTLDKEYEVAVQAVKLVISIYKFSDQVLTSKDCENVYELVFSSHRGVAQAAGEFLNVKLFSDVQESATHSRGGKKRSANTPYIRDLVCFFIESELHEHGAYLVDSLWEMNDMMKDWECMTDLLIEEAGPGEEALDDRQESALIEIMVCCVKQAATGEYPVGRGTAGRKISTRETRQVIEDKVKLTEHFITALPQLLAKYDVDSEKVANLLNIPVYFDLDIYTTGRHEKHLESLLRHIDNIVSKHTSPETLEACSKVLELVTTEGLTIANKCGVFRSTLIDRLAENFRAAMTEFFQQGEDPDEDDAYALLSSLRRIFAFFSCHDLNGWNLWQPLFEIVNLSSQEHVVPKEIMCKAIACCHVALMWQMSALTESNPDEAAIKSVKKHCKQFIARCSTLLDHPQSTVQEEAYISICDLLIVFSKNLTLQSPHSTNLDALVYSADSTLQLKLSQFLNDKVFIEDDDDSMDESRKIEELHKRRNFLAAFCKLIVYNVIKIKTAADMFKYYLKFYNDYGDIIKATLGKAREINKVHTAKTLALSLTQLFRILVSEQGTVDRNTEGFMSIKELGRRFALSFGLDFVKNREAVAAMHKDGILFVVNGLRDTDTGVLKNIAFLEILCEFSGKLLKQDKKVVLGYLNNHFKGDDDDDDDDDNAPLAVYRHSLTQGDQDSSSVSTVPPRSAANTGGRRGRGAKRKIAHEHDDSSMSVHGGDEVEGGAGPLTSTVMKRSRGSRELHDVSIMSHSTNQQLEEAGSDSALKRSETRNKQTSRIVIERQSDDDDDDDDDDIEDYDDEREVEGGSEVEGCVRKGDVGTEVAYSHVEKMKGSGNTASHLGFNNNGGKDDVRNGCVGKGDAGKGVEEVKKTGCVGKSHAGKDCVGKGDAGKGVEGVKNGCVRKGDAGSSLFSQRSSGRVSVGEGCVSLNRVVECDDVENDDDDDDDDDYDEIENDDDDNIFKDVEAGNGLRTKGSGNTASFVGNNSDDIRSMLAVKGSKVSRGQSLNVNKGQSSKVNPEIDDDDHESMLSVKGQGSDVSRGQSSNPNRGQSSKVNPHYENLSKEIKTKNNNDRGANLSYGKD